MSETRRFRRLGPLRRLGLILVALAAIAVGMAYAVRYVGLGAAEESKNALTTNVKRAATVALAISEDATTTAKVKTALVLSRSVDALGIDVDSRGSSVTLTGVVPSGEAEAAALRIARDTEGVTEVVDRLEPTPASRCDSSLRELEDRLADVELRSLVYEGFLSARGLDATGIEVVVEERVVTLSGTVDSVVSSRWAEAIAASIAGVESVVNDTTIVDSPAGTSAVPIPDEYVALHVRDELFETGAIRIDTITIEVRSGVVEMTGTVRSEAEKQLAEMLAGTVEGVVEVVNALEVT